MAMNAAAPVPIYELAVRTACDVKGNRPYLSVQEENPCVLSAMALADACGQHYVEEHRLPSIGIGLHEQGANRDVIDDATQTTFQWTTAVHETISMRHSDV